jgi:hypothetical protein
MLLPTHLRTEALGLRWGMSQDGCLAALGTAPTERTPHYAVLPLVLGGDAVEVVLNFDGAAGLCRIDAHLRVSRDFWEPFDGYAEEMARIDAEYRATYHALRERYVAALGPPRFSGTWEDDGFPEDEPWVALLTYWDYPQTRVALLYEHPDQELPMFVTVQATPRTARFVRPSSRQ